MDNEQTKVHDSLLKMPRFAPALLSVLVLGLLLLFYRDFDQGNFRNYLVASTVVYCLGASLLGMFHRMAGICYQEEGKNNECTIPKILKIVLYFAHTLWLISFIWYLAFRGLL